MGKTTTTTVDLSSKITRQPNSQREAPGYPSYSTGGEVAISMSDYRDLMGEVDKGNKLNARFILSPEADKNQACPVLPGIDLVAKDTYANGSVKATLEGPTDEINKAIKAGCFITPINQTNSADKDKPMNATKPPGDLKDSKESQVRCPSFAKKENTPRCGF